MLKIRDTIVISILEVDETMVPLFFSDIFFLMLKRGICLLILFGQKLQKAAIVFDQVPNLHH